MFELRIVIKKKEYSSQVYHDDDYTLFKQMEATKLRIENYKIHESVNVTKTALRRRQGYVENTEKNNE